MAFGVSPGVYSRELDRSFNVEPILGNTGMVVVTSTKGPLEPTLITSERQFLRTYGNPSLSNPSMYTALSFLNRIGSLYVTRIVGEDAEVASGDLMIDATPDPLAVFTFEAVNPGTWGNAITVGILEGTEEDTFTLTVTVGGEVVESFQISEDQDAIDGFGNALYIGEVLKRSNYIRLEDHDDEVELEDGVSVTLTGGLNGDPVTDAEVILAIGEYSNKDRYSIDYLINGGWISSAVHAALNNLASNRRDCVAILDLPNETDVADLVTYRKDTSNINSSFSAYYAGWIRIYDVFTAREIEVPPSGHIAAVFAITQSQTAPWAAPAGLNRGVIPNVVGVNTTFNESQRDVLYIAQINPIQNFPGEGIVVWGQKNAQIASSSTNRLNVRFLLNYVRVSLDRALRPFVFQSNSAFTRSSIESLITNFMEDVRNNDGVFDYRVVIDDINTPEVIDRNELLIELFIKPTRTAEFIRLDVISVPTAQSF